MNYFVYKIDKIELDSSVELRIYKINEKKEILMDKIVVPYTILVKSIDFESLNIESDKIILAERDFLDKNGKKVVKLEIKSKELYLFVLSQLRESNFITYESDLPYEHRYLIDNDMEIISENFDYLPLKVVSIDIETIGDRNEQEIVLISSYSPNDSSINKVYCDNSKLDKKGLKRVKLSRFNDFELVNCSSEKEMIERFKQDIIDFKPQVIIGWNVIDFDFKVIKERMNFYNIEFKFSGFDGKNNLRIFLDFLKNSMLLVPGVLVFDVIHLLKMNFIVFEDYKLDTVAKKVLGDKKIDLDEEKNDKNDNGFIEDKIFAITNMLKNDPNKLIEYNFKDSVLTSQIVDKLNLLELMCKRSIMTGTPLLKVKSPIATLDIMYLKELRKRGFVAPSNFNFSSSNPIEGAFVKEPKRGFYEDMFVFDFKSLYPSIIMTFNIDPFTYCEDGKGVIKSPTGATFSLNRGILPQLILKLYKERDIAKSQNDDIKSYALKINMNSFYGAIASPKSRFHNHEIGESITGFARFIIKKADVYLESKGHKVIYNDTDSAFVIVDEKFKSLDEKLNFGKNLQRDINEFFEKWVEKEFGVKNYLKIEFDKLYSKFFIASKKRYVGYDEISKNTSFTGMESVRGDWTPLAREFQVELVDLIFNGKDKEFIEKFVLDKVENLKKGKFDNLLIYTKKTTKPLKDYVKMTPPHVKAARELKEFNGRVVKYIMTKNGPKHISLVNDEKKNGYDYKHYIDKQLKGVSDDLLEAFGIDFDNILFKKKQTALDKFF